METQKRKYTLAEKLKAIGPGAMLLHPLLDQVLLQPLLGLELNLDMLYCGR